jgi:hypothetical protein
MMLRTCDPMVRRLTESAVAMAAVPDEMIEQRLQIGAELLAFAQMDILPADELDSLAAELEVPVFRRRILDGGASTFRRTPGERRMAGAVAFLDFRRAEPANEILRLARVAVDNGDLPAPEAAGTMSLALAISAMIRSDEIEAPRRLARRVTEWALARGAPGLFAMHMFWLALIAQHEGDLHAVVDACDAATEAGAGAAAPLVGSLVMPCRIEAAIEQGEIAAARAMLEATGSPNSPPSTCRSPSRCTCAGGSTRPRGTARRRSRT